MVIYVITVIINLLPRAITMIITALPSANRQYKCDPQLNHTITAAEVINQKLTFPEKFIKERWLIEYFLIDKAIVF